jgi:hypothetical protein
MDDDRETHDCGNTGDTQSLLEHSGVINLEEFCECIRHTSPGKPRARARATGPTFGIARSPVMHDVRGPRGPERQAVGGSSDSH